MLTEVQLLVMVVVGVVVGGGGGHHDGKGSRPDSIVVVTCHISCGAFNHASLSPSCGCVSIPACIIFAIPLSSVSILPWFL